jgi:hypothetical protein
MRTLQQVPHTPRTPHMPRVYAARVCRVRHVCHIRRAICSLQTCAIAALRGPIPRPQLYHHYTHNSAECVNCSLQITIFLQVSRLSPGWCAHGGTNHCGAWPDASTMQSRCTHCCLTVNHSTDLDTCKHLSSHLAGAPLIARRSLTRH